MARKAAKKGVTDEHKLSSLKENGPHYHVEVVLTRIIAKHRIPFEDHPCHYTGAESEDADSHWH